jgi:hypothetical protein
MGESAVFRNNMTSLRPVQPRLVSQLEGTRASGDIVVQPTREGVASVALFHVDGTIQLHSRYNPVREASRMVDLLGEASTLVTLGGGGMFVPREYLGRYPHASALVVERNVPTIRALLEIMDLSRLIETGRLRFAGDGDTLSSQLAAVHQPAIQDGVVVYELRPWTEREDHRELFREYRRQIQETLRNIAGEYGTMRHYGRPWFVHTFRNTLRIDWNGVAPSVRAVAESIRATPSRIVAAGPSLDERFSRFPDDLLSGSFLNNIVVDTALPAAIKRRLPCFGVVALDPQGWSPLHFRGLQQRLPVLWADLGVSPQLHSRTERFIPLGSNHPLHRLLADAGFPLFHIPGSRNVSETAARLVHLLGGTIEDVVGADFSYPAGKTYARDTYHYTVARSTSTRIYPEETFFADQVYRNCEAEPTAPRPPGQHPLFRRAGMVDAENDFRHTLNRVHPADSIRNLSGPPATGAGDIRTFWLNHAEELRNLPGWTGAVSGRSTPEILSDLGSHGRAHLPLLPIFRRPGGVLEESLVELFEKIRGFIFSDLGRYSK